MTQRGRQPRDFTPDPHTGHRKWFDIGETATQILARKTNANGRSAYRTGIVAFCDANMIADLDAYIEQAQQENHVIDHIEHMVIWLQDQGRAPYTIKTNLSGVKYLFRRLKLKVDNQDIADLLKDRELARAHTVTKKVTLRKDELRKVISQLPSHGKARAPTLSLTYEIHLG
jgi:ribosome-interacting GTPase 1